MNISPREACTEKAACRKPEQSERALFRSGGGSGHPMTEAPGRPAVLDELNLAELATLIPGASAVGAVAVLAQTGEPRQLVKQSRPGGAGESVRRVCRPTETDRSGRPGLRLPPMPAEMETMPAQAGFQSEPRPIQSDVLPAAP